MTPRLVVAAVTVVAYAALAAVLTGCGSSSGSHEYLYTAVDVNAGIKTAQYIQIVHSGSSASGTSDAVLVLIGGSIGPQRYHYTVTGTDNESQLTLTLSKSDGSGTWKGRQPRA